MPVLPSAARVSTPAAYVAGSPVHDDPDVVAVVEVRGRRAEIGGGLAQRLAPGGVGVAGQAPAEAEADLEVAG